MSDDQDEICWDTPSHSRVCRRNPAEASERWEFLPKSALPSLDLYLWCLVVRGPLRFHFVLSFPNSDWQAENICKSMIFELWPVNLLSGTHLLSVLFLAWIAVAFWFVSFCVLRIWLGNSHIGGPQNMAGQKCGLYPIRSQGPMDCCQLSGELSVFILVVSESGSGSCECSIFCTLFGDGCRLSPCGCSMLLGIFTVCPNWNLTRYSKGFLFIYLF